MPGWDSSEHKKKRVRTQIGPLRRDNLKSEIIDLCSVVQYVIGLHKLCLEALLEHAEPASGFPRVPTLAMPTCCVTSYPNGLKMLLER